MHHRSPPRSSAVHLSSEAAGDYFVLSDMKASLRRHLAAGLIECSALSRDLCVLDADALMAALNGQFDPHDSAAPIQDCFSDGFGPAAAEIKNAGGEPLAAGDELPSGVPH